MYVRVDLNECTKQKADFFIATMNAAWRKSILLVFQEDNKKMNVENVCAAHKDFFQKYMH